MSTAQELLDALLVVVETPTNDPVRFSDIESLAGFEAANLVYGTLEAAKAQMPLLGSVITAMSTTGLVLSDPARQAVVEQLAALGKWPQELQDTLKQLAISKRYQWQIEGYTSEPTLEQLQAKIDREALDAKIAEAKNEILNVAESASDRTKKMMAEAYRKAADLMEA
jgi:hypothetical protein